MPWAYSITKFIFHCSSVRATIAKSISRCHYLQFAIGGLFGDWASVAATVAHKQGRAYAIHTDRVEHQVILQVTRSARLLTRLKAKIIAPIIASCHRWIVKNCALGLFHGSDCYEAYSPFCHNSHLIHNVHIKPRDAIDASVLAAKVHGVQTDRTIRICYAGRMEMMKAPMDWVRAISTAQNLGVNLHATWMGDGTLKDEMKALIASLGLDSTIELSGFEPNRERLLQKIRESHLMLFTHVTPESPRCLLEALACGTPIVGYQSKYCEELIKDFGGGMFVPVNDWKQLGELISTLSRDRPLLQRLIEAASINGTRFNDEAVFKHRSKLIEKYLTLNSVLPSQESNEVYFTFRGSIKVNSLTSTTSIKPFAVDKVL